MPQVVLVPVVADGTEVVVGALGALPPNSENRLLAEIRKDANILNYHSSRDIQEVECNARHV